MQIKVFRIFSFKVGSIALDPDPDPNWAKILDPDRNSMYLDPKHWQKAFVEFHSRSISNLYRFREKILPGRNWKVFGSIFLSPFLVKMYHNVVNCYNFLPIKKECKEKNSKYA